MASNKGQTYSKEQICKSSVYLPYRDLLSILLDGNKMYTKKQVDGLLNSFLKRPIKEEIN